MVLNHMNHNEFNALMIAAESAPGTLNNDEARQFIKSLLSLGADKNTVQTKSGLSALGIFYNGRKHFVIIDTTYGRDLHEYDQEAALIEQLLTPDKGATVADCTALQLLDEEIYGADDDVDIADGMNIIDSNEEL